MRISYNKQPQNYQTFFGTPLIASDYNFFVYIMKAGILLPQAGDSATRENVLNIAKEVEKVILDAVTSDNPQLKYVVGNDAARIMEARKNMSDREFGNLRKKQFNLQNIS